MNVGAARRLRGPALGVALILALLSTAPAWGQVDANQERGFAPGKVYDFSGVDSVNLFNGNLVLTVPIGPEYPVNGGFSYRFMLTYNSNVWDVSTRNVSNPPISYTRVEPSPNANAGLGWVLTLGQLYAPAGLGNPTARWLYVAEDGSQHSFYSSLHIGDGAGYVPDFFYTRDGAYLRLRKISSTEFQVDSPDGTTRVFTRETPATASPFQLTKIHDAFGNEVGIDTSANPWVVDDGHRTHEVWFTQVAGEEVVDRIVLAAYTVEDQPGEAVYQFHYGFPASGSDNQAENIHENCRDQDPLTGDTNHRLDVALLSSVTLPESAGSWRMDEYYRECTDASPSLPDLPGVLKRLVLPTLGQIEWTYREYLVAHRDAGPGGGTLALNDLLGVATKKLLDPFGTEATWPDNTASTWTYTPVAQVQNRKTVVHAPTGDETVSYFSQASGVSLQDYSGWQYGMPYTNAQVDGEGFYLSQEVYEGSSAQSGNKRRSVWVRYEHDRVPSSVDNPEDWYNINRRVVATKTVYVDDSNAESKVVYSDFDGLGHYRTMTSSGFGSEDNGNGGSRIETTLFNPARGTYAINPATNQPAAGHSFSVWPYASNWVLGTYTETTQSEGSATERQEYCFEAATGFLKRVRTHAGGSGRQANDLLTVFTDVNGHGNVTSEAHYGGDVHGVSTSGTGLCSLSLPSSPEYEVDHTYAYGTRKSTTTVGSGFYTLNATIDAPTGLVKTSLDTALVATGFVYDKLGRLTNVNPQTGTDASTRYSYTRAILNPSSLGPARVDIQRLPNGGGAALSASRVVYDAWGRVGRNRRWLGDGDSLLSEETWDGGGNTLLVTNNHWATQDLGLNALGWRVRTSTWYAPGETKHWTSVDSFDAFGRPSAVQSPDGTEVSFSYAGDRQVTRTVQVATAYTPATTTYTMSDADTRERSDWLGRLIEVREPAGTGGANVKTTYGYDVGGRLATVSTPSSGVTQTRSFVYDGRGFLLSESHPEKGGPVTYSSYDARGLAGRRREGAVDGPFDLDYVYDVAGRLLTVSEHGNNQLLEGLTGIRVLKELSYGSSVAAYDRSRGKLKVARRHNWVPHPNNGILLDVIVEETYLYGGRGGRVSQRDTKTDIASQHLFTQGWTWDELGHAATLTYPACTFATCTDDPPLPGWSPAPPRTVGFGYREGLLVSVSGFTGTVPGEDAGIGITYHADGLLARLQHGNGVLYAQERDATGMSRPGSLRIENAIAPFESLAAPPGLDYSYDGAGNVIAIGPEIYLYDQVSRVTSGRLGDSAGGLENSQAYSFDGFGNLKSITTKRSGVPQVRTLAVDASTNRLSQTAYDTTGNQLEWGSYDYTFDAFGMVTRFTGDGNDWTYIYTADDQRLWTVKNLDPAWDERFDLRDLDGKVLRSYGTTGGYDGPWEWRGDYVWRNGTTLAKVVPEGTPPAQVTYHYHPDHLGSPRLVTGPDRVRTALYTYFPFGEPLVIDDDPERMRFTGHERDNNGPGLTDDLDYMHARYCSPMTGRFLSADPVPPMRLAMNSPQDWNLFSYAAGNPTRYVDPRGLVIELPGNYADELKLIKSSLIAVGADALANALWVENVNGVNQIARVDSSLIDATNSTASLIGGLINDTKNTVAIEITSASLMSEGGATTRAVSDTRSEIRINPATVAQGLVSGRPLSGPLQGAQVLAPISASTALVHELGHASANAHGFFPPAFNRESSKNYHEAMRYENDHRRMLKGPESVKRTNHHVYFPNDRSTWYH